MENTDIKKECTRCKITKSLNEYPNRKDSKDGKRNECIVCYKKIKKEYGIRNRDKRISYMVEYRIQNPTQYSTWKSNNYEKYRESVDRWKLNNPDKVKKHKRDSRRRRYIKDPLFRIRETIRRLINLSFTRHGILKSNRTNEILGCSYNQFKEYIQSKFVDGMNWDNRCEWELDHIIPISSAQSETEVYLLNHYTNFQPLWRYDNRLKSDYYKEEDKNQFLFTNTYKTNVND
jgi:hypothetical protein